VRIVLDTNVLVSGIFYTGPPYALLDAWRQGALEVAVSPDIIREYRRVVEKLGTRFPQVESNAILKLLIMRATVVDAQPLPEPACSDPHDDKFLACALASGTKYIVSGDKHLLTVSGYAEVTVLRPLEFLGLLH